jgi:F-box and leucine-rich repeat protein GRR1
MARPPAPALDVIAARNSAAAAAVGPSASNPNQLPVPMAAEDSRDSRSSSSTNSPAPADNEESDFYLVNNDSQSSLGVVPNLQDMQVTDRECLPTVAALPSEILISIFSRINEPKELLNCMLTCKRWARNVVEILWHRPSCTTWEKHSSICNTLGLEQPFFTYTDFIKRLNLAALADCVNDGSVMPLAVCTRVERLTLTNCIGLTDVGLTPLVRSSQHLLALDISGDNNITEASITAIAENCRKLQGLNISGCKHISNESLVQLAENCRFIKRVCFDKSYPPPMLRTALSSVIV